MLNEMFLQMTYIEKIRVLESCLNQESKNYKDSFKTDLYLFFNEDFSVDNPLLEFLNNFSTVDEIEDWVNLTISQIILKFDEEFEQVGNFIGEFVEMDKV